MKTLVALICAFGIVFSAILVCWIDAAYKPDNVGLERTLGYVVPNDKGQKVNLVPKAKFADWMDSHSQCTIVSASGLNDDILVIFTGKGKAEQVHEATILMQAAGIELSRKYAEEKP
jgi:hypothetical protein